MVKKIYKLPEHVVSQIAAGEVIERPVYAVKELIENSIDAQSNSISITIEEAGLKKIVVSDNGEGMSGEDIIESVNPHTTSKIYEELVGVKTLGFRGEALSSISAISNMTIQSRLIDEAAGTQITLKKGEVMHVGPVGMPSGTTVVVQNLFYPVPARKKFLKSERTEFRHIVELVTNYGLSYPHIRFLLIHNGRVVIDLPKNQSLEERIEKLLGSTFFQHLLTIIPDDPYFQISGFIARPQISSSTQGKQYIYVNNRVVSDKTIMTAVKEAYGNLLENNQYPVFIIFIKLPEEMIDVNVHPRKETIAFINNSLVFDVVKSAVVKTLSENNLTFYNTSFNQFYPRSGTTESYAAKVLKDSVEAWSIKDVAQILTTSDLQQLHNLYLLTQTKNGILLIDQHAAHERILYEQFLEEFNKRKKNQKTLELKKPYILELSLSEGEVLTEYQDIFTKLGFEIDEFSTNVYRVNKVPELFKDRDIGKLIIEILENVSEERGKKQLDHYSNLMISFLSCRAAIKAGDRLEKNEARKLIDKLEQTKNNATCPHGRPTKIEIPLREINKMFKRS